MNKTKPREFWILPSSGYIITEPLNCDSEIHVIERSYATALEERIKELESASEVKESKILKQTVEITLMQTKLTEATAHADKLRASLKSAYEAFDEIRTWDASRTEDTMLRQICVHQCAKLLAAHPELNEKGE